MLVEKSNFKANTVIAMKLSTTEEMICRLAEDWDQKSDPVITKPLTLMPAMTQDGRPTLSFGPFMATQDPEKKITIAKEHVVTACECRAEISSQYLQMTTGLTLASNGPTSPIKV